MNKFTLLFLAFFIMLPLLHLQAQTGLQITSTCQSDSLCLPANECVSIDQFFSISATTDCSTSNIVEYNFFIDWNDDGVIDSLGSAASFKADFPIGSHRVKFTAFDFCGGEENCEFVFEVMDCVAPVIEIIDTVITFILPSSGQIELFPEHYISSTTFDNCTSSENLTFSFSSYLNTYVPSLYISCSDIPCDGIFPLTIWAEDESGNKDSINVEANILDPNGGCILSPILLLTNVYFNLWNGTPLENSIVKLNNFYYSNVFPNSFPCNGSYPLEGDTIFAEHEGDDYPLNGVTTFDLVLISKHILGIDLFYSPYQSIAADVNFSGTITALDLAIIRSVILYVSDEFPDGKSWVYDPPFVVIDEYEESYEFVGIKLGDVNGSANPNEFQNNQTDTRTFDGTLNLSTQDQVFKTGETITITTFANNFDKIIGGQFTIDFDPIALAFQSIEGNNSVELNEENFGKNHTDDGLILCSWNTSAPQNLNVEDVFYNITFTAKKDGRLSNYLTINSKKINAEVYVENRNGIEFWNAALSFKNETHNAISNTFTILPNPFSEKTTFNFSLENAENVELEIFDTNGRLVFSQQKNMLAGENQIEILKANLPINGIYFYKIKTNNNVNTGKIISQ
ncbi:MAG: T9SS type A sorting domain-containing protein [Saprospiraceae bacterium]